MLAVYTGINAQQFSFDNNTYKTVFPEDLCKTLKENNQEFSWTIVAAVSSGMSVGS